MHITFAPRDILQIDDARIIWPNFEGRPDEFTREGERSFHLIIPNQALADELINRKNQYGAGWNVKIKAPRNEGEEPFMHMKVKVKFTGRGPNVYLKTGDRMNRLDEESVGILDKIKIRSVDMDIRPYDDEGRWGPFRTAYLESMCVTQEVDRFAARFADEEYPGEEPF